MCGFAGFADLSGRVADPQAALRAMSCALAPRGPDDAHETFDAATRVGLAFRRLAILDLSPAGRQPMRSPCGRYEIAFNGEVYNHAELRARFGAGRAFAGHSDTEAMLAAIESTGVERAIHHFRGMFAFALLDRTERVLWLVRDRFGVKPLAYALTQGHALQTGGFAVPDGASLAFASDLRALRGMPGLSTSVSRAALTLYMRHGHVPGPCTIHAEVRKLRPGHLLRVDLVARRAEERSWWHSRDALRRGRADRFAGSDDDAIRAVDEAILESVRMRMVSDVPVGAFLSGGIDSSAVVAAMQQVSPRPVRTFTIGFDDPELDESGFARAVAAHLGTDHTELRLSGRDAVDAVPEAAAAFDEPFADSSLVPTWLVARLARGSVAVALSGDGGDELFGGYYRYGWVERVARANGRIPRPLRGALGALLGALPPGPLNSAGRLASRIAPPLAPFDRAGDRLRKLAPMVGRTDPWALYLDLTAVDRDAERLVLGGSLPTTALTDPAELCPEADLVERMMQADLVSYLVDDILVKVDRATMAQGLEAREPLLDHPLAELALRLPPHMRIRGGERKWILRRVAELRIPRSLLERPKRGFSMPLVGWLRGPLRPWAEALLDESRLVQDGFLDPREVRRRWDALAGASDSDPVAPIWTILMFQAWLERERRGATGGS